MRRWFEDFDHATWDLAAFYFGNRNDFACGECVHVESGSGTKWSFLYKFAKSDLFQKKFARQYKQVYRREVADRHLCTYLLQLFHVVYA